MKCFVAAITIVTSYFTIRQTIDGFAASGSGESNKVCVFAMNIAQWSEQNRRQKVYNKGALRLYRGA